jgi:hypothetical protein
VSFAASVAAGPQPHPQLAGEHWVAPPAGADLQMPSNNAHRQVPFFAVSVLLQVRSLINSLLVRSGRHHP